MNDVVKIFRSRINEWIWENNKPLPIDLSPLNIGTIVVPRSYKRIEFDTIRVGFNFDPNDQNDLKKISILRKRMDMLIHYLIGNQIHGLYGMTFNGPSEQLILYVPKDTDELMMKLSI